MPSSTANSPLLVACLCAQWCGSCRDYRSTFNQVADAFPQMRFVWVDIEDEADLVDPVEVENFPTLLVASEDGPRFFGPLMPHKETLVRLLLAQTEGPTAATLADAEVHALAQRIWKK
jgi:thioredoxin 1